MLSIFFITSPLKNQINGVKGMIHMDSSSTSPGAAKGTQQGGIVDKQPPSILCFVAVRGDERYDDKLRKKKHSIPESASSAARLQFSPPAIQLT
jgi:hypothetical protein